MALPIKPNNTQESCNPISSNCIIWQGPDIPCIKLCNGDSVSDVTAKLAEQLCNIIDQLDVTSFDLSCFNPVCPSIKDFNELIQFVINKLCDLTNADALQAASSGDCPDNCLVVIPDCFGEVKDCYGNRVYNMSLKDFALFLASKICDILASLTIEDDSIKDLETRVKSLEGEGLVLKAAVGSEIIIPNSCITGAASTFISEFVKNLETAFCALQLATGTPSAIIAAIGYECAGLNAAPQLDPAASGNPMGVLTGWNAAPTTLSQSFSNLWQTVCDLRGAVATLQTDLTACCTATFTCPTPTITLQYCAPNIGFTCTPLPGTWTMTSVTASIRGSRTNIAVNPTTVGPFTYDGVTCNALVNVSTDLLLNNSLYFDVNYATFTFDDGLGHTCTITEVLTGIDGLITCPTVSFAPNAVPVIGELEFSYAGMLTGVNISLQIAVFTCASGVNVSGLIVLPEAAADTIVLPQLGLFTTGEEYRVVYSMTQNGVTKACGQTTCATAP